MRWHIFVYGGLMFSQYNDFTIYKTRNIIDYVHIHYVIEPYIFYRRRKRKVRSVQGVVKRQEIFFCFFIFAEKVDKYRRYNFDRSNSAVLLTVEFAVRQTSLIDVCAAAHQCNSFQSSNFVQLLHFKESLYFLLAVLIAVSLTYCSIA